MLTPPPQPPPPGTLAILSFTMYAICAALAIPMVWEFTRFRLAVGPEGLDFNFAWSRRQFIRWEDIDYFEQAPFGYVIRLIDRRKVDLSNLVGGLDAFWESCKRCLPPEKLVFPKVPRGVIQGVPIVDPRTGFSVFRDKYMRTAGLVALGLAAVFGAVGFASPGLFIPAGLLLIGGIVGVWSYMRFRIVVSREGIESPWSARRRQFISWSAIENLYYKPNGQQFVVHASDGRQIEFPASLTGVSKLLEEFERRIPADKLEPARDGYLEIGRRFPVRADMVISNE